MEVKLDDIIKHLESLQESKLESGRLIEGLSDRYVEFGVIGKKKLMIYRWSSEHYKTAKMESSWMVIKNS